MIREVLLITPGRYDNDDFFSTFKKGDIVPNENRLTPQGIEDARCLGDNIIKSGSRPGYIFSTPQEMCVQTAHIIAGRVESIRNVPSAIPGIPINGREARAKGGRALTRYQLVCDTFWKHLRGAFCSSEGIQEYLSGIQVIPRDVEQIAFVSSPAFHGVFNQCKSPDGGKSYPLWVHPTIYKFDVVRQSIFILIPYDFRYGCA